MPTTKKIIFRTLKLLLVAYILICTGLFFFQEKLIFFPDKLEKNYKFTFEQPFEEVNISTQSNYLLHGLLFKSDSTKGLIFYLHGNAGSLRNWGSVAKCYTDLHYDVFILDYPGYGKSGSTIKSQTQLFNDIQTAYDEIKTKYKEGSIVVIGYSIGAGLAAKVSSINQPRLLILQAPYYSLTDLMQKRYPIVPTFLLKYRIQTGEYLKNCKMPVVIFHGNEDEVIYYGSSLKLKEGMKAADTLITLKGQGHNRITDNLEYKAAIQAILR